MNEKSMTRRSLVKRAVLLAPIPASTVSSFSLAQSSGALSLARIIVGSGAGSVIDTLARRVCERLTPHYSQSAIVENRTGASGQLAVSYVKNAPKDGATILLTRSPHLVLFPYTFQNLPYRPATDLMPVSIGATFDLAFAVGPAVPEQVRNLHDFVRWCKANPDKSQFGSPAAGSTPHFAGAMLARAGDFRLDHVAYRGPGPAVLDMVGGHIAAACAPLGDIHTFAKSEKCRILATTGSRRSIFMPGVPTFSEMGFKDVVIQDWVGFFLPANTPKPLQKNAQDEIVRVLSNKELQEAMAANCYETGGGTAEALAERMRIETARWKSVVTALGFTAVS